MVGIGKFDMERGGGGCVESGPSPLFEPTSALFRDVINGLCSYNSYSTSSRIPLSLSLSRARRSRTNRARNPDRSGGNLVSPPFSSLPFPSLSFRFVALKGYRVYTDPV